MEDKRITASNRQSVMTKSLEYGKECEEPDRVKDHTKKIIANGKTAADNSVPKLSKRISRKRQPRKHIVIEEQTDVTRGKKCSSKQGVNKRFKKNNEKTLKYKEQKIIDPNVKDDTKKVEKSKSSKIFPCQHENCGMVFTRLYVLVNHMLKKHEATTINIKTLTQSMAAKSVQSDNKSSSSKIKRKPKDFNQPRPHCCEVCKLSYTNKTCLIRHVRATPKCNEHYTENQLFKSYRKFLCHHDNCGESFCKMARFVKHMQLVHGESTLSIEHLEFNDLDTFKIWKEKEEYVTYCYFSCTSSKQNKDGASKIFACQFDGSSRPHRKKTEPGRLGVRKHKKGQIKKDNICTARMIVKIRESKIFVEYVKSHSHDISKEDMVYQPLPEFVRNLIERKVAEGYPTKLIEKILNESEDPHISKRNISKERIEKVRKRLIADSERYAQLQEEFPVCYVEDPIYTKRPYKKRLSKSTTQSPYTQSLTSQPLNSQETKIDHVETCLDVRETPEYTDIDNIKGDIISHATAIQQCVTNNFVPQQLLANVRHKVKEILDLCNITTIPLTSENSSQVFPPETVRNLSVVPPPQNGTFTPENVVYLQPAPVVYTQDTNLYPQNTVTYVTYQNNQLYNM